MLTQRVYHQASGGAYLVVEADPAGLAELLGLADELNLRSTVQTEGPIHQLNDPEGNARTPSFPPIQ